MPTLQEIVDRTGGLPVLTKQREGYFFGGVFVGSQLVADEQYAEEVAEGRWVIRSIKGGQMLRCGEVFGGRGKFVCSSMKGDVLGQRESLTAAAQLLVEAKLGSSS